MVGSKEEKQRAERMAQKTSGIREDKNNLTVDEAAVEERRNTEVSDDKLAKSVAEKLANDTFPWATADEDWLFGWEVDGYNWEFDVEADDGSITLDGAVDSYSMRTEAAEAARKMPGVKSVNNYLTVDDSYSCYYPHYYTSYPYYHWTY